MSQSLKLGKAPARKDAVSFKLTNYMQLPTPPTKAGHQVLVIDWEGMLGNDQYGDCVFAGADHETILWNKEADLSANFSATTALSDYSKVTGFNQNDPSTDNGTDMQVAASYRRKTGIVDTTNKRHKVTAYLALTPKDKTQLKQAIYLFGAVGVGVEFPASAMTQFNANKPWTVVSSSKIEGGHYVPAVGYDSRYIYVITWGKLIKMSWGFYAKYNDESVAYISSESLKNNESLEGFNLAQLEADLNAL
jgi:hypothetical protein